MRVACTYVRQRTDEHGLWEALYAVRVSPTRLAWDVSHGFLESYWFSKLAETHSCPPDNRLHRCCCLAYRNNACHHDPSAGRDGLPLKVTNAGMSILRTRGAQGGCDRARPAGVRRGVSRVRSNGAGFTQRRSVACRIRLKSAPRSNRVTLLQTKVTVGFAARRATALARAILVARQRARARRAGRAGRDHHGVIAVWGIPPLTFLSRLHSVRLDHQKAQPSFVTADCVDQTPSARASASVLL